MNEASKQKRIITTVKFLLSITISSLLSVTSNSAEVSMHEFLDTAQAATGEYEATQTNSSFCFSGYLAFLNPDDPEEGIRLGQRLILGPFTETGATTKTEGYCKVTHSFRYQQNSIEEKTTLSECEANSGEQDVTSTQQLEIHGDGKLTYRSLESGIECHYAKISD